LRPPGICFDIKRNGIAIGNHPIKQRYFANPNITFSQTYVEWDACIAANLDPYLWFETSVYSDKLKAQAIAWHSGHQLIKTHTADAGIKKGKGR
jgi:hypothetical protein